MRTALPIDISPQLDDDQRRTTVRLTKKFKDMLEQRPDSKEPAAEKERRQQNFTHTLSELAGTLSAALFDCVDGGAGSFKEKLDDAVINTQFLQLNIAGDATMQSLPWELAADADPELGVLAHNPNIAFVRRARKLHNELSNLPPKPLRILLFISAPEDLDPEKARLDYEGEINAIEAALDEKISAGKVILDIAEDGRLSTLKRWLEQAPYHVVHFSMHGNRGEIDLTSREEKSPPALHFEDEDSGNSRAVAPEELEACFQNAQNRPPLLLLAACQTADFDARDGIASFAQRMHAVNFANVIGMQLSVADSSATNFAATLYQALLQDIPLDAAMARARAVLQSDGLQWSIPVLYSSVKNLTWNNGTSEKAPTRQAVRDIQIGQIPFRSQGFIGRRRFIRAHYRRWASGAMPHLLIHGIGGVGKTTLAGHFALRLQRESADTAIFTLAPPFELEILIEQLQQACTANNLPIDEKQKQAATTALQVISLYLYALAPSLSCIFIVDNLEDALDLQTMEFTADFTGLGELVTLLTGQTNVHTLLTCRHPIASESVRAQTTPAALGDASHGDILRLLRNWDWPAEVTAKVKNDIYATLGGNFRSIEWCACLLGQARDSADKSATRHSDWQALKQTYEKEKKKSARQAKQHVLQHMQQNLLFKQLLDLLGEEERKFLAKLALEENPLPEDAATALWPSKQATALLTRCSGLTLLQPTPHPLGIQFYFAPPLVRELLQKNVPLPAAEKKAAHAALAHIWRHYGEQVTRLISDDLRAIAHFEQAGLTQEAFALRSDLGRFFVDSQRFREGFALLLQCYRENESAMDWNALNTLGRSQRTLGDYDFALEIFQKAETRVHSAKTEEELENLGTTLNNISQIYDAKGDYETALKYLQQSLKIRQQIGDKSGEGTTLNNLSQIYKARGDYDTALKYLQQSLKITQQIGDKSGEGTTLNNLSQIYKARGDYDTALKYLQQSLKIKQQIGDKSGEGTTLNNLSQIYKARGDYDTALKYLQQSLKIQQ
ncbi:MAG: CHAT domain-containing protein, partial [Calditrichaeota bacterium]